MRFSNNDKMISIKAKRPWPEAGILFTILIGGERGNVGLDSQAEVLADLEPLRHSMNVPGTKVVLSLGGGGVRMFAHAAVFDFLEKLEVTERISEVWGSSGGAIMGCLFAMGMSAGEMKDIAGVAGKGGIVRHLPSYFSLAKRLFKDVFGFSKHSASLQVFRDYQKQLEDFLLKVMGKGWRTQKKFFCTAFNLDTQDNEVLSSQAVHGFYGEDKVYQVDTLDAVMASSAVPVLFAPRVIRGEGYERRYMDGALIEDIPTQSVYKKWVRDKELGLDDSRRLLLITVTLQPSAFISLDMMKSSKFRRLPGFEHVVTSLHCAEYMREASTRANKKMLQQDPSVELWDLNITVPNGGMLSIDLIPGVMQAAADSVPLEFRRIRGEMLF